MKQPLNENPEPTEQELLAKLAGSLNVSSLDNTFDNFKPVEGTERPLAACKALVGGDTDWSMLLIYGGTGNGKTHLCEATAIELYKQQHFCRVVPFWLLMKTLKRTMGRQIPGYSNYDELFERYCDAERLILDDVGASATEWELLQLESLIVSRYQQKLFTLITTNMALSPDPTKPEMPFMPERVVSRFKDKAVARIVLNKGEDYRPKK